MRYLRLLAERHSRRTEGLAWPSFSGALLTTTALIVALGALAAVGGQIADAAGIAPYPTALVLGGAVYGTGLAASELAIAHYQALHRFTLAGCVGLVRAAMLLGVAIVLVGTPLRRSTDAVLVTFAGGMLVLGLVTCATTLHADVAERRFVLGNLWVGREERSLTAYYVAAAGFAYVDILVAGALLGARQIATLGATLRYVSLVLGAFPALNAILKVRTSQMDVIDSSARQRELLQRWMRRMAAPCVAAYAIGVVAAPSLIPLVDGGRYPGSHEAFQVYLLTALAAYLTAPAANLLITQLRSTWLARTLTIALVVNLVGDVVAARPFGVIGIAVVSTSVYVLVEGATVIAALSRTASAPGGHAERPLAV
jgi:O-antigen/teichoic acid export membrane protein